jgi:hypothetical protein
VKHHKQIIFCSQKYINFLYMLEDNLRLSSISPLHIFSPPPLVPAPFCPTAQKKKDLFCNHRGFSSQQRAIILVSTVHNIPHHNSSLQYIGLHRLNKTLLLSLNSTRTGTVILFPKGIINFDGWMNFVVILGGASWIVGIPFPEWAIRTDVRPCSSSSPSTAHYYSLQWTWCSIVSITIGVVSWKRFISFVVSRLCDLAK